MKNSLNFYTHSYDKNSIYYDETYFFLNNYKNEARFIKGLMDKRSLKKFKILDLGCGTGNLFLYFQKGIKKTGIDISKEMIEIAKSKKIPNSKFIAKDFLKYKLKEKYDIIYISTFLIQTFNNFGHIKSFIEKIKENLSENGIILFNWIDEGIYSKVYKEERFGFSLKNGWNCYGESHLDKNKRIFKLNFCKNKKEIKSSAKYLLFSKEELNKFFEKMNFSLKFYDGKYNGLNEDYHKWGILTVIEKQKI